jgi:hypothetical protein
MKKSKQNNLSIINGNRLEREQELVELLFIGAQDEIDQKLCQLEPRGQVSLVSENPTPSEQ